MQEVHRRLKIFIALFFLVTAIGTFGFMKLENLSFADALYYNIVTMSTVGYGDIHPTSQAGRALAVFLIVLGVGTFLGVIANITEMLILRRELQNRVRKINMVQGIFFSEAGYKILFFFLRYDHFIDQVKNHVHVKSNWTKSDFSTALKELTKYQTKIDAKDLDLKELSDFLKSKRDFLIGVLENPMLVEHEDFSDALISLFHLLDELSSRSRLNDLPKSDLQHLTGDINRAYKKLIIQWIIYLRHLKKEYPYIFSLAVRTNPFDKNASPVVLD